MLTIPLRELKEKIKKETSLTEEEINQKIKKKINELSGLVSEEGAAHIIANELGINFLEEEGRLKIKNIYPGMRKIEVLGKVISKSEIKEFDKGKQKGKVGSFLIGDETGTIRVVCWHEQNKLIEGLKEGDIVLIKRGQAKENTFNQKEIHLNENSELSINPEGEVITEVRPNLCYPRKRISDLKEGETGVEILATVVQVFDPRFFLVCPECNKRVREKEDGFYCPYHEKITPLESYVLNLTLDDGSSLIRGVFWKNQTNNLLEITEEEMFKFKKEPGSFEDYKTALLGEQFRLVGKVVRNEMFERLEFQVQLVFKAEPEEEIKRLEEEKT